MRHPGWCLRWLAWLGLLMAPAGCGGPSKAVEAVPSPTTIVDPRLQELRLAMPAWATAPERRRRVLDVVVIVPDWPGFLDAVSRWDADTWFPILFDDPALIARFVSGFRPARLVRHPGKGGTGPKSVPDEAIWAEAQRAVSHAWRKPDAPPPSLVGLPGEPGVVLSASRSPHLAAAVALAAGRFEPLLKWEVNEAFGDETTSERAESLAAEVERRVAGAVSSHDRLGDRCDFLTIANDAPFRYRQPNGPLSGPYALDDLLGRDPATGRRWAYAGRLFGSPAMALYQAMGSLFLTPRSAALVNAYGDPNPPWKEFDHATAERHLRGWMTDVRSIAAPRSSLDGWLSFFDPRNRAGLVLVNSSGDPSGFNLPGGVRGQTADIPSGDPSVVFMIHSYSAADLKNRGTIARRWLDQGAYAYLGAMEEPYLAAFRTPALEAELIAAHIPLGAVARPTSDEPFGQPWRLLLIGDPLYRIRPRSEPGPRAAFGPLPEGWVELSDEVDRPDEAASEWAGSLAIHRAGLARDWPLALSSWEALVKSGASDAAVAAWTGRVSALATALNQVPSWRESVNRMARERPERQPVVAERDRLAGATGG